MKKILITFLVAFSTITYAQTANVDIVISKTGAKVIGVPENYQTVYFIKEETSDVYYVIINLTDGWDYGTFRIFYGEPGHITEGKIVSDVMRFMDGGTTFVQANLDNYPSYRVTDGKTEFFSTTALCVFCFPSGSRSKNSFVSKVLLPDVSGDSSDPVSANLVEIVK